MIFCDLEVKITAIANEGITSLPTERETLLWEDGCPVYDGVNPYSVNKKKYE